MNIPNDYYESEVRDGFYVPSEMKRCWASTIGVLEVIDRICQKHGLTYYADYGTLLGAVRHGGFIPWDDDFDISMKREDYMRFIKVSQEELPENYLLLSVYNNPEYDNFLARVVNSSFISLEQDFLEANHNFPYAVGIDIFPLDYYDHDQKENETIKNIINSAHLILGVLPPDVCDMSQLEKDLRVAINRFCSLCGLKLERGKPIRQQIFIFVDRMCSIYDKTAPCLTNMYFCVKHGRQIYRKELFDDTVRLPFEYSSISAPIGYDEKLRVCYGVNYMKPYMGGGVHEYPLYGQQEEVLLETTGKSFFNRYMFEKTDIKNREIKTPQREKREIVFLPFRAKYWSYMEKEWELAVADDKNDVYVIPIPYYEKGIYGLNGNIHYEADMFPDYVGITPFDRYDFDGRVPDRVYIQNPYDENDSAITVHPRFYTKELLAVTKELVYIPYFEVDDRNLANKLTRYTADFFIKVPGVTRSDRIYLQSEALKELYVDKLCEFAGEDTKGIWTDRIIIREDIVPDKVVGIREEDIPDKWWKYLLDNNGEGKKVVLYYTNVSNIVMKGKEAIDKIERVLNTFMEKKDVMTPIWYAHPKMKETLETRHPDLWSVYRDVLNRYISEDFGIYEDTYDFDSLVAISDAYYGDRGTVMNEFSKTGRPIMIANVSL